MRSEGKVRQQLKQVIYRHLQKRLRCNFKKEPETCKFNKLSVSEMVCVRICDHAKQPKGLICDSRVEWCLEQAKNCELWAPRKSKAAVKEEFKGLIESGNRGLIAMEFPDVAALMWVLDEEPEVTLVDILEEQEPNE